MADDEVNGDSDEIQEKSQKKTAKYDSGAADLEKVTDYAEEKEISAQDFAGAISAIGDRRNKEAAEKMAKERELLKISIKKEDVDLIVKELEISQNMYNNAKLLIILMSNYNNSGRNNVTHDEPNDSTPNLPNQHYPTTPLAISLIIFAATMFLIVLMSLVMYTVCCKYYRRRENRFFGRSSSFASLQELIRVRLQDRPPTYHESQISLATAQSDHPPPYNEVVRNASATEPTIFIVSSKRIISNENENLPRFVEDDSDSDSPPSYYISEGVVNTIAQERNNNHIADNRNDLELESYRNLPTYSNMLHI
ncbi:uncharacterized protein CBL_04971 [Carabus blaptoides fortunei]